MTATGITTIEQLQLMPEDDRLEELRSRLEDQWFERKSARCSARDLGDLLIGFANAEGGLIVLGIDAGQVEGVADSTRRVNDWRQAAIDYTEPAVRHRFELLPCLNRRGDPDEVAVVEVEASEQMHQNLKGETYLRIGDENRRLGVLEAQELRFDKGQSIFDGTPVPESRMSDLDEDLVNRYLERVKGAVRRDVVLASRGLVAPHGRSMRPTVAGLLVLGKEPQRFFPEAVVRLLRYQGPSRETGARSNVVRDVRLDGPLSLQIDAARRRVRRWLPSAIRLQRTGRFAGSTLIPQFAWVEAVVNAVIHRSYSMSGDHVRVELFDDRLEVESPGRLPGLVRVENIRSTRFARNPRVARALADLRYGRELGEGVNRMFEEMERVGLPDPIYTQGPASVRVTFLADALSARIAEELPDGAERFVEYLSRNGRVTTSQAVDLFGVSRPTALRHLHHLHETGFIEHTGTSLNDPRGYWRLRRSSEQ
jgi:ATP-dependent DNA helicase RecG